MGAPPVASPIVPAAILFDIGNGGAKTGVTRRPITGLASRLLTRATEFALGNSGAGFGAQAGQLKGGLGSASTMLDADVCVGALLAVNPSVRVRCPWHILGPASRARP